jgi:hypothetical protein
LEELTEYGDVFAVDSDDYGRTNKMYHRIDTGDPRKIRHPESSLPVAKKG